MIDGEELLHRLEQHEKYLIAQLKKTDDKRYFYQLMTMKKVKKIITELEKETKNGKVKF